MPAVVSPAALIAALNAAGAASGSNKDSAYIDTLVSQFGNVRREVRANGVTVLSVSTGAPLSRVGNQMRLAPLTGTATGAATTSATLIHRVVSEANPTNFIESTMGAVGSGAAFTLSGGFVQGQTVSLLEAFYNGPGLNVPDALSLTLGSVTNLTSTSFTLSVVVAGTIPAGAVTEIQWTDGVVPWVKSPNPATTVGTFSHTFTNAPSSTLIRWRAFVFTPPATTHASTSEGTFTTPAGVGGDFVDNMVADMGNGPNPATELPGMTTTAPRGLGGFVIMGGDLRPQSVPSWWNDGGPPGNNFSYLSYWTSLVPWTHAWDMTGHQSGLNVRLHMRDLQLWILVDGATSWQLLGTDVDADGDYYERDVVTANPGDNPATRIEPGGGVSIIIVPNGRIYHGYAPARTNFNPATVRALHTRFRARKILDNPSGPDQRSIARYAIEVGLDPYPFATTTVAEFAPATYNPACGGSRYVEVFNDWKWVFFTTLASPPTRVVDTSPFGPGARTSRQTISEADFRALPPPPPSEL